MKRLLTKNNKGFSLIELMIVVAIIGILAAIAVPNYQKFTRKAKQAGGKSLLSGYYTSAKATMAEMGIHKGNFAVVGFKPEGELIYRLDVHDNGATLPSTYAGVLDIPACVTTTGSTACASSSYKTWSDHPVSTATAVGGTVSSTNRTFLSFAAADLDGAQPDRWSINQNKDLRLVQDGTD
ncbi:MAG: prepilin-type N-terminal cleavage/methylation domain-containing protein [Bdellovibrionota bacterium]|nr:prepilin-type N-terminal cleavage/methylation domain-containing protein [Bdellovibrionota bacterium]